MGKKLKLLRPQRLFPGDRIGVIAPAGPVQQEPLEKGLRFLKRMGFQTVPGRTLGSKYRYLSSPDETRAEEIMEMFSNKDIKAIFCARGGYGIGRILPMLSKKVIRANPKIFIGASDITIMLNFLHQNCGLVSFHGPMVAGNFGRHQMTRTKSQCIQLLSGNEAGRHFKFSGSRVLKEGTAKGTIVGGCLTLLCRSLGTPWEIDTRDRIVLIEDVNEAPYRIDGMLCQLQQAGKFRHVKGIVFGEMINCHPGPRQNWTLDDAIGDFFRDDTFPILINCPIGHGKEMWTIPVGVSGTLSTNPKSLEFEHCGVL